MLWDFFRSAGQSPTRQRLFRWMVVLHLAVLGLAVLMLSGNRSGRLFSILGDAHVLLGIVEGAILVGWRLAQWPKSQALEPLLLANLSSRSVMAGEQSVGIGQLFLLALSGVPVLVLASMLGWLDPASIFLLPLQSLIWGSLVGFGLVVWAYESASVRRVGERVVGGVMTGYFLLGGLAGEHTLGVLRSVPMVGDVVVDGIWLLHTHTPFAVLNRMESGDPAGWFSLVAIDVLGVGLVMALLMRSAARLEPHYVDRHYKPIGESAVGKRGSIGDEPLSWWAVRRVGEYAGRVNLYLAGGTAVLYAAYLLLGPYWPTWLGQRIFWVFEQNGGVATMTTILIILSAVPAAYQYGLWDSSKTDRCRRLETLLTTDLGVADFEGASWSASWSRGRGYFYSAILLWVAAGVSGRMDWLQVLTAMGAGCYC